MTTPMPVDLPDFAKGAVNLASGRLGAIGLFTTDEFFAPVSRMLSDDPAVFIADKYDDHGKWMDGWESRRKRVPGHDHAVIRLAMPGRIAGFDVDTSYFTGNYPPHCSIEAAFVEDGDPVEETVWTEILPKSPLGPSAHHYLQPAEADRATVFTHLRLHIYPDGGIARLRVYGSPISTGRRLGRTRRSISPTSSAAPIRWPGRMPITATPTGSSRRAVGEHGRWLGNGAPPRPRP